MMNYIIVIVSILTSLGLRANPIVNEKVFEDIGSKVVDLYKEESLQRGWNFDIEADWTSKEVEATLKPSGRPYFSIYYTGGLIKKGLSADGLAVVLCHEAGHLFGKRMNGEDEYYDVAAESEADYFSTNNCLKKLWTAHPDLKADSILPADKTILKVRFKNNAFAMRAAAASLQSLRVLVSKSLKANARDKTIVKSTLSSYPSPACRLESYYAGIENGKRPSCWFKTW